MLVKKTAESVSLGHPDKSADYISSYILDRYLEKDPGTRYAVEVMLKGNEVIVGGEVKSSVTFSNDDITMFVKNALSDIGYSIEYEKLWKDSAIENSKVKVINLISGQSEGISVGVSNNGWGDQGVFVGYATNNKKFDYLSKEQYYSKKLNYAIYSLAKSNVSLGLGLDIKTQITIAEDKIDTVIVAVPLYYKLTDIVKGKAITYKQLIEELIIANLSIDISDVKVIINGTGDYVEHSSIADCGITGRKLACDFYSVACPLGGGSPWTKDASKADVTLNIYARTLAVRKLGDNDECYVYLSSCIGRSQLPSSYIKYIKDGKEKIVEFSFNTRPNDLINMLDLRKPCYAEMCRESTRSFLYNRLL